MAMSPNELKALLATMDTVLALCEVVGVKGNVERIANLREKIEKLEEIRKLAKGPGLGRTSKE